MRSKKRLSEIRALPCVRCGQSPSQAAHSNSSKHGKGRGIKASDEFTVPLCAICHGLFDQFNLGTRQESEAMFERWLEKTERMLKIENDSDCF
ncbi:DUF968 domain-containing protein [Acinetobacter baumannii]|uniref:DUF968 domain-containing protein n=1 Tax=Acinetobacter baumannii TaxID=470 RepID=UPI001C46F0C5|nr:DUF968 domain-containing protein [Acinetobacter baumannii]EHU1539737.1 DUF968 domain-containing protein [Acinetobacter baumannii]EHU2002692.1 DUF968 domain-containing protein [Acinetobacter baumannii]MBV6562448.1 DUF968 domain-containing protein [Acinetobacter baumannii]MBV6588180.1 DUF968 domain-containing protein [Acinetobacter baumannii]